MRTWKHVGVEHGSTTTTQLAYDSRRKPGVSFKGQFLGLFRTEIEFYLSKNVFKKIFNFVAEQVFDVLQVKIGPDIKLQTHYLKIKHSYISPQTGTISKYLDL